MREGQAATLSPEQFRQILRVSDTQLYATRNRAILYCSFGLGFRCHEIATLTFGQIVDDSGQLRDHFQIFKRHSKTNRNRDVYLTNTKVRRALQDHVDDCRQMNGGTVNMNSVVFRTQKNLAFTGNTLQQMLKRLFVKAGMPDTVKSHSGRRTFATTLIENGTDIKSVALLMGHANVSQTAQYVESNPNVLRQIASKAI